MSRISLILYCLLSLWIDSVICDNDAWADTQHWVTDFHYFLFYFWCRIFIIIFSLLYFKTEFFRYTHFYVLGKCICFIDNFLSCLKIEVDKYLTFSDLFSVCSSYCINQNFQVDFQVFQKILISKHVSLLHQTIYFTSKPSQFPQIFHHSHENHLHFLLLQITKQDSYKTTHTKYYLTA